MCGMGPMWRRFGASATGFAAPQGNIAGSAASDSQPHGWRYNRGLISMTRRLALLAALALATAGVARAQCFDVIETRQAGQDVLAGTFAGIRAVVAAKGDVKTLENPAKYMARWIKQYPTLFPKGSETGHDTKALPAIWSDT